MLMGLLYIYFFLLFALLKFVNLVNKQVKLHSYCEPCMISVFLRSRDRLSVSGVKV